ncbi:MAG: alpha/beta hydrolase [Pirellulaceae bacterium]|nr:alpha/beta hydrolase [Pirellulaceae bacterium]
MTKTLPMHSPYAHLLLIVAVFAAINLHANRARAQDTGVSKTHVGPTETDHWYEKQSKWNGFDRFHFRHSGSACYLIVPTEPLPGNPWIWRARFPDFHAEMDVELIRGGYHLAYFDVAGKFGCPETIERATSFYNYLVDQRGLNPKPALEGVSRGGLFVYNWAAKHPDRVACIYCDTPVLDFRSWPAGQGTGVGSVSAWKQCLQAYGLTESEAADYKGLPIDHAEIIAAAKIPLLHIVSENDRVVPPSENTYVLRDRLKQVGHPMEIITVAQGTEKSNGHHFTHPEPQKVIDFIRQHAK